MEEASCTPIFLVDPGATASGFIALTRHLQTSDSNQPIAEGNQ